MKTELKVLDHGFVKLRNVSGPTRRIYEDASVFHDGFDSSVDVADLRTFDADDTDPANSARIVKKDMKLILQQYTQVLLLNTRDFFYP